jgi:hypothetical protein
MILVVSIASAERLGVHDIFGIDALSRLQCNTDTLVWQIVIHYHTCVQITWWLRAYYHDYNTSVSSRTIRVKGGNHWQAAPRPHCWQNLHTPVRKFRSERSVALQNDKQQRITDGKQRRRSTRGTDMYMCTLAYVLTLARAHVLYTRKCTCAHVCHH